MPALLEVEEDANGFFLGLGGGSAELRREGLEAEDVFRGEFHRDGGGVFLCVVVLDGEGLEVEEQEGARRRLAVLLLFEKVGRILEAVLLEEALRLFSGLLFGFLLELFYVSLDLLLPFFAPHKGADLRDRIHIGPNGPHRRALVAGLGLFPVRGALPPDAAGHHEPYRDNDNEFSHRFASLSKSPPPTGCGCAPVTSQ